MTVYETLKQRIILLDIRPGVAVNTSALANELGVSVTPVREALIRLESDGLIRRLPNSAPHVTEVHLQDLKNVLEVRLLLAEQIARLAAQRVTPSEIEAMKASLEQMSQSTDRRTLIQLDSVFHELINSATKNNALSKVAELMRNQVVRLWFYVSDEQDYWENLIADRGRLVNALRERDSQVVAEIMREHILQFIRETQIAMVGDLMESTLENLRFGRQETPR